MKTKGAARLASRRTDDHFQDIYYIPGATHLPCSLATNYKYYRGYAAFFYPGCE